MKFSEVCITLIKKNLNTCLGFQDIKLLSEKFHIIPTLMIFNNIKLVFFARAPRAGFRILFVDIFYFYMCKYN